MKSKYLLFPLLLLLVSAIYSQAQAWSGILAPSRSINWSSAGATITNRTSQCGSTIAPYSGTATAINNAIAACGANQYVLLGAGTFNLSNGIIFNNQSNVTLRGAGADQTSVVFSGTNSCGGLGGYLCDLQQLRARFRHTR